MQNFKKRKKKQPPIEDANIISEEKKPKQKPIMAKKTETPEEMDDNKTPESNKEKPNVADTPIADNSTVQDFKDPLIDAEPIIPEYAKVQVDGEHNYEPIPEEPIERPTVSFRDDDNATSNDNTTSNTSSPSQQSSNTPKQPDKKEKLPPTMGNPDLDDKTNKEKKEGAKYFAQTLVDGYEALHIACTQWLEKTDDKLMKMAMDGKIEIEVIDSELDLGGGTIIRIKSMIDEYNQTVREVLVVSPEFKQEILPLLEAELMRRGIGMTTMQRIIAIVVKDLQPKLTKMIQMTAMMSSVLQQQSLIIKNQKELMNGQRENATGNRPIIINDIHEPNE